MPLKKLVWGLEFGAFIHCFEPARSSLWLLKARPNLIVHSLGTLGHRSIQPERPSGPISASSRSSSRPASSPSAAALSRRRPASPCGGIAPFRCERFHGGFKGRSPVAHQSPGLFDVDFEPCALFGRIVRRSTQGDHRIKGIFAAAGSPLTAIDPGMMDKKNSDAAPPRRPRVGSEKQRQEAAQR